ncbi:MAG: FprA family A-type flavoprotein, partial [Bacteroidales bacterium]|nr:FprA family A-type flavoprotein [Bacteroidales bacterium]
MKEIASGIRYIGVDDLDLDLFESQYVIPEGMSYNSYLILDEKVAVLDTVDARKADAWLEGLQEALEDRKPDYLIVNHMEPDHSGVIGRLTELYPEITIVATAMAVKFLGQFNPGKTFKTQAVKEGDTICLGGKTLKFFTAPMVHWPEVMVSFEESTGTLFSADAFGKFGAISKSAFWADEDDWACEARRYYFNICGKYGPQVSALLKKLPAVKLIAPLHGPLMRNDLSEYLNLYKVWSAYEVESEGVMVAYASIHGGTKAVAEHFADLLKAKGCPKVVLTDLTRDDRAEAIEDAFRYGTLVMAAASYDAGLFTPAYDFLHSLQMKGWQKRRVALIENGTWAPTAGRVMKEMFGAMKEITLVGDLVTIKSVMTPSDEPALEAL